jgi:hypothetical protein
MTTEIKSTLILLFLLVVNAWTIQAKPKIYDHTGKLILMWLPQFKDEHRYTGDFSGSQVDFACSSNADSTHCRDLNMLEEFVFDDGSYGPVGSTMGMGIGDLADPLADLLLHESNPGNVSDLPQSPGFKQHIIAASIPYRLAITKDHVSIFCLPVTKNGKQHGEGCYLYSGKTPLVPVKK